MKRIVTDERYEEQGSQRTWACVTLAVIFLAMGLYCLVTRLMEPVWLYAGVMIPGGAYYGWEGWRSYHRRLVIDARGVSETHGASRKAWRFRWDDLECVRWGSYLYLEPKDETSEFLRLTITVKDQFMPVVERYARVVEK